MQAGIKEAGLRGAAENAGWIIGGKIAKAILMLGVVALQARYLGPERYGLLRYAESITMFAAPVMKLGLDSTLVHELVSRRTQEGEVLGTAITMNLLSALLSVAGIFAFVTLANAGERETLIVCMLYSTSLLFQAAEMLQYWLQAKLLSKYFSAATAVSYAGMAAVQVLLALFKCGVIWFALASVLEYAGIAGILLAVYRRKGEAPLRVSFMLGREMLRMSGVFILSNLMLVLYEETDRIMLELMQGSEAVGQYAAATTCATMVSFVFAAIIYSARPGLFERAKQERELFEKDLTDLYAIVLYSSAAVCVLLMLLASLVIRVLYGTAFLKAVPALRLVVWITTLSYFGAVRDIWLLVRNRQKLLAAVNLTGAALNIGLNLLLIPVWGIMGAAVASVVTQAFANIIVGFLLPQLRENNRMMLRAARPETAVEAFRRAAKALQKNENRQNS